VSVCLERLHAHLYALRLAMWSSEEHPSTAYVELIAALTSRRRAAAMRALSTMLGLDSPPSTLDDANSIPDVTALTIARPRRKNLSKIPSQAVSEKAYRIIKAKIISFEFRPGERLSEQALAESVDASRATVREVLVRLAGERLTVWRANLGFSIRTLDPIEMFDLYELRAGLEAQAVAIVIERGSDAELRHFQADWQQSIEKF
jgi:DNA-binding transcriptional regulator YhcF (GntR family)